MAINVINNWRREFGFNDRTPPKFFLTASELKASIPQSHVLRKAFELLELDGILCVENSPLIYFKEVQEISQSIVSQLLHKLWNHGSAPVLVLISTNKVHVYSGMSRPVPGHEVTDQHPSLVKILDRVSEVLQSFILSVESGEFFKQNERYFNPDHRVDRDLLNNLRDTRDVLDQITNREITNSIAFVLDALLCRLVFTCYLFDRDVINHNYLTKAGIKNAYHLRDILSMTPKAAKAALYRLFEKLGEDFNGDLFNDDLESEIKKITHKHIQVLSSFFQGTLVKSGQTSFWPYDFSAIPIETISAIYEHFLKDDDHESGAFYTPRFLAEVVLDTSLEGFGSLLGKKFLDPACGSGIFLVGLFNRIAEEWKQANPTARNDRRARELMEIIQSSLFGVDINPTACRITAFSLYLAYLDQLTPRDIRELQIRGRALPSLVAQSMESEDISSPKGNIKCIDFFSAALSIAHMDLVVGNPPWASIATDESLAGQWCIEHEKPLRDKQIAVSFIWKAGTHISSAGRICFVLPYGTLFNHSKTAVAFQKEWITQNKIERVINLADFRQFLFEKAGHPAIVVRYNNKKPSSKDRIEYWTPKTDWTALRTEIITISPSDRTILTVADVQKDLEGSDAPQIWKLKNFATSRDVRLIERLSLFPRLRDHVRSSRDLDPDKPFVMAEGFQPVGKGDDPAKAKTIKFPSRKFIPATSNALDLFLLESDSQTLKSSSITVRSGSNTNVEIFKAPHVLIAQGFRQIAFSDFDVSFQHALRGIHGSTEFRDLLIFLTAYLRSRLARYFMFHTSSSWGMYRSKVHVQEILRLPLPFPAQHRDSQRAGAIVKKVASLVDNASKQVKGNFIARSNTIQDITNQVEPLIEEYFDIQPLEKLLIEDTLNILIPSIQPSKKRMPVPTLKHTNLNQQTAYVNRVCEMLSLWGRRTEYNVKGKAYSSEKLGVSLAVFQTFSKHQPESENVDINENVLESVSRLKSLVTKRYSRSIDLLKGLMVFDNTNLFVVKPIGQRYWSQTAALNDADEIASSILMHSYQDH